MPLVDCLTLGDFQSNCYLVRAGAGATEAIVVDPGGDPSPVEARLAELGATVAAILVTHSDVDHIAGVADLAERTGAVVWAPANEAGDLRAGRSRTGREVRPHEPEHLVEDGDTITAAGLELAVIDVPGHSTGHVAFHAGDALFSGDLVFAGSVGRVDLPGGDWSTLLASVRRLLERVGPEAVVYPGHGGPTTLGRELASSPFLGELRAAQQG
jgi:glyoxylase-like metal-dependent hydrolase (beta-lactamase superfamily II)